MCYREIKRIATKETTLFFSSPIAYLFLGSFLAITLFIFFWGEAFFARNIADVRPMFEWMPVLLIFLSAAITMRSWSEERRLGTLEQVITLPVRPIKFVIGKFFACLALLALALLLTLPLPITLSWIASLDWGPIWAAYLATMLLGAAYISIGLFVSSRSESQIVSLIVTCFICGIFYIFGSSLITSLFSNQGSEVLRSLGTGSRFVSITRGVIDLRDLLYYISIVAIFLSLNVYSLERGRWAAEGDKSFHRRWRIVTMLLVANAVIVNIWLSPLNRLRVDVTHGQQYTLSSTTKQYMQQLQEPLLIRGYFSAKTHPLLAPLVGQLKDLISEYEVLGNGQVKVEFIDPQKNPELEQEANSHYGIKPTPFQIADKYQASLVNSYFNVLVQYGDQFEVLGFRELIELKARGEGDVDVKLKNPEYDVSRAIKKVLYSFQSAGNLFEKINSPLAFKGYISQDSLLPEQLVAFKQEISAVLDDVQQKAGDKFVVEFVEPDAKQLDEVYGFKPMAASMFDANTFFFYMVLENQKQVIQIPFPDDLSADSFKVSLEAGIKRFSSGFTKTVGIVGPTGGQQFGPYGGQSQKQFNQLRQQLMETLTVRDIDLHTGQVPGDVDFLMVLAPQEISSKQLYAIDQFLMQGGTVLMATSPLSSEMTQMGLEISEHNSGVDEWLKFNGINISQTLVLDPHNTAFPIPVTRQMGGVNFQEIHMLDYPYFVDVRGKALNQNNGISSSIPQLTVPWASPINVDTDVNAAREVVDLVWSSDKSWVSDSLDIMPKMESAGGGFYPEGETAKNLLGVMIQGKFGSYFVGKDSPLLERDNAAVAPEEEEDAADKPAGEQDTLGTVSSLIERSPEAARLIVFSSNDIFEDQILGLLGAAQGIDYNYPTQMVLNAVEWSLEDRGLLSIRARGHFNRTLPPMGHNTQMFWEYLNYTLALLGVVAVALLQRARRNNFRKQYAAIL